MGGSLNATVPIGSWWQALLLNDFPDWRQDFLSILDYSFFFEYNVDTARFGRPDPNRLMVEIERIWDMPDLPYELQVRRSHMACSMAFFDVKRKHEATIKSHPTDGLTIWTHSDRDRWRDFKAVDSGGFSHYLSFAKGAAGRDDMMLAGLVNDWVALGPDLRYEECNQSVLALTRGSLVMEDLLAATNAPSGCSTPSSPRTNATPDACRPSYCTAMAALVMEQWWAGIYFAIGIGSLVDAQPDRVAGDRSH